MIVEYECRTSGAVPPSVTQIAPRTYRAMMAGPEACALQTSLLWLWLSIGGAVVLLLALGFLWYRRRRAKAGEGGQRAAAGNQRAAPPRRAAAANASSPRPFVPPADADSMSPAELRRQVRAALEYTHDAPHRHAH
jgi:hypothetical protein